MPYARLAEAPVASALAADELARLTQEAAAAAGPWIGENDKNGADGAAVDAMRAVLAEGNLSCRVRSCEGEKDEAPMFPYGEEFGARGGRPDYDIFIDPIDRTTAVARGTEGGISVAALAPHGNLPKWTGPYMKKLVVPPAASEPLRTGAVRVDGDPTRNLQAIADALGINAKDLRVAVLERERNRRIIEAAQKLGAHAILLEGGDVLPVIHMLEEGQDDLILYGSGGVPEGLIVAIHAAAKGAGMQGAADPQNPAQARKAMEEGVLGRVMDLATLAGNRDLHFAATAITDNEIMDGAYREKGQWQPGTTISASKL